MTPRYARARRGTRAVGYAPARGKHVNLAFGLGLRGFVAPLLYPGTTTTPFVTGYMRQALAPALHPDEILLLDRHPTHDLAAIRRAVRARGAHLWQLPPYSPDLSPAEFCGSKLKHSIRQLEPRTDNELLEAAATSLRRVTPQDIVGWFRHCGYHGRSL
jgi:transposase